jgi:hypothetical protein
MTMGVRGGFVPLGDESPPCPHNLLQLELIGTVKSNRVMKSLGQGSFSVDRCREILFPPRISKRDR